MADDEDSRHRDWLARHAGWGIALLVLVYLTAFSLTMCDVSPA